MMVAIFDERELVEKLHRLSAADQELVVSLVERLGRPKGEPGHLFIERTRDIHFNQDDVQEMEQAIEEAVEQPAEFQEVSFD
jgi:hypothetical protein